MADRANIILIGFMGTGKTAIGKRLAQALGRPFIDTDKEIEKVTGMSIAQIFNKHGEIRFRSEEKIAIKKACASRSAVIATGGGGCNGC
jgi:shikimate kinase